MSEKIISIKDLIDKKEAIGGRKLVKKIIFVKDLEGNIEIVEPTKGQIADMKDRSSDDNNNILVAECVVKPDLKDPELLKAYGCVTSVDLVKKMFRAGTIAKIATELVDLAGFGAGSVKVIDEIKN